MSRLADQHKTLLEQALPIQLPQILCIALMLRHSFQMEEEARAIEASVETTLKEGYRTRDNSSCGRTRPEDCRHQRNGRQNSGTPAGYYGAFGCSLRLKA